MYLIPPAKQSLQWNVSTIPLRSSHWESLRYLRNVDDGRNCCGPLLDWIWDVRASNWKHHLCAIWFTAFTVPNIGYMLLLVWSWYSGIVCPLSLPFSLLWLTVFSLFTVMFSASQTFPGHAGSSYNIKVIYV